MLLAVFAILLGFLVKTNESEEHEERIGTNKTTFKTRRNEIAVENKNYKAGYVATIIPRDIQEFNRLRKVFNIIWKALVLICNTGTTILREKRVAPNTAASPPAHRTTEIVPDSSSTTITVDDSTTDTATVDGSTYTATTPHGTGTQAGADTTVTSTTTITETITGTQATESATYTVTMESATKTEGRSTLAATAERSGPQSSKRTTHAITAPLSTVASVHTSKVRSKKPPHRPNTTKGLPVRTKKPPHRPNTTKGLQGETTKQRSDATRQDSRGAVSDVARRITIIVVIGMVCFAMLIAYIFHVRTQNKLRWRKEAMIAEMKKRRESLFNAERTPEDRDKDVTFVVFDPDVKKIESEGSRSTSDQKIVRIERRPSAELAHYMG